ncbi:MAG: creatininase family protein [Thermodesulfovibrionales bacterium]|nr:creatininase family protein [Thermodesulfovibrionales bacterium]
MYLLERITMVEFERYLQNTKTIVFPFGTIEEHGSHLPLNTDSLIIQEALLLASKRKSFFLAPLINYGVCTSTKDHPGTITISADTLRRLAADLVIDSYRKGLRNFLLISGHGGSIHLSALRETAEIIVEQYPDIKIAVFTPYDILYKELAEIIETPNDSHAGEIETSIVLYLYPELVKGLSEPEYPQLPKPFIVKEKLKYWPGGVWGDPKRATAEKGKKAINLIADKIISVIEEIESRSF